jgi:WD40 repeat protein
MSNIKVHKIATLTGHNDCIYTLERGKEAYTFFSAGGDGMIVEWDLRHPENGKLIAKVANSVYALQYISGKNQLLVGHNFEGVHLIDVLSGKELHSAAITESAIFDIKVSGAYIYVATGDGTVVVLLASDLSTIKRIKSSDKSARSIALNERAGVLAVGYSDQYIRVFSLSDLSLIKEFEAHQNSVFTVTFSPDGLYLLSGSRDAHLNLWDTHNFQLNKTIVAHMYAINHIEYSPDGKYFLTCSMDKSIKVWDAVHLSLLKVIDKSRHAGHGTSVNKMLWSAFNNYMVSCSDDRTISIWDITFNR